MKVFTLPSQDLLRHNFHFSAKSGHLYWNHLTYHRATGGPIQREHLGIVRLFPRKAYEGLLAGCVEGDGYRRIQLPIRKPVRLAGVEGRIKKRISYKASWLVAAWLGWDFDPVTQEIHHLNGDRADTRPKNLVIMERAEHRKLNWGKKFIGPRWPDNIHFPWENFHHVDNLDYSPNGRRLRKPARRR